MGLFSKKTITCERCGREYQTRNTRQAHLCEECLEELVNKDMQVRGYVEYADKMHWNLYPEEEIDAIIAHRNSILEKYRQTGGISRQELFEASENYKNLSDDQAADILNRVGISSITTTIGAAYNGYFIAPTQFARVVVDTQDIFAVGYTTAYRLQSIGDEVIMCAVFTNDPYFPAFPMVYTGKLGFFEIMKSKKGRQGVAELFELLCPNLTYPVQELKKLKKQIKSEGRVNGNIDSKAMLDYISSADVSMGVFETKNLYSEPDQDAAELLDEYGYITDTEINAILKMDKLFNRKYWQKQIKRLADYDIGEQ